MEGKSPPHTHTRALPNTRTASNYLAGLRTGIPPPAANRDPAPGREIERFSRFPGASLTKKKKKNSLTG